MTAPGPLHRTTATAKTLGFQLATPLERNTALDQDVTWQFEAGPFGASSTNPDVGLTVVIPPGALTDLTTITVTALAGAPVAYRFEPHVEFQRSVQLVQDLSLTNAGPLASLALFGGHFSGDALELTNGLALVDETAPAVISVLTGTATISALHFTGWIVASGTPDDDGPLQ